MGLIISIYDLEKNKKMHGGCGCNTSLPAKTRATSRSIVSTTVAGAILHSFVVYFVGLRLLASSFFFFFKLNALSFQGTLVGCEPDLALLFYRRLAWTEQLVYSF
jgi:hypothetical protein